LGRVDTPEDIAGIALFPSSNLPAYVTNGIYLSVVDYVNSYTVLPSVVRDAQALSWGNRSPNSLERVNLHVITDHFS
jgi:hypothetical protein